MMWRVKLNRLVVSAAIGLCVVGAASVDARALVIDPASGVVTDWGISPFGQTGTAAGNHAAWQPAPSSYLTYWIEENNYSRVQYPSGIDRVPSPGGQTGEAFDMEALYWRIVDSNLQVLLVTSMGNSAYISGWNRHYRLGDLFLDVDGDQVYDVAVATTNTTCGGAQSWLKYRPGNGYTALNHAAVPGTLFRIDSAAALVGVVGQNYGGYGDHVAVATEVTPWVVDQSVAVQMGSVTLTTGSYGYGTRIGGGFYDNDPNKSKGGVSLNENGTWFYEWIMPLSLIDPNGYLTGSTLGDLGLHITVECGNDYIGTVNRQPEHLDPIPEPVTAMAMLIGAGGLARYVRRRLSAGRKGK